MVSTVLCPRCNTKNSKTAEICYNCKKPLKSSKKSSEKNPKKPSKHIPKKPLLSYINRKSIDLKIIAIGAAIFILSNIILLDIAENYSVLVSGFATLLFTYAVFKKFYKFDDIRSLEVKVLLNYIITAAVGTLVLILMYFLKIIN